MFSPVPVDERQGLLVTPGDDLVSVTHTDAELTNCDHLLLGVVETLVELPPHHVDVTGQGLQVVQGLLGAEVACAQDVLDTPRHQELLELGGQSEGPVRYVEVTKN